MIKDTLKNANLEYVSKFLLYEAEPIIEKGERLGYNEIIENSTNLFRDHLTKIISDDNLESEVIELANKLLEVYEEIYFKAGVKAGMNLSFGYQFK